MRKLGCLLILVMGIVGMQVGFAKRDVRADEYGIYIESQEQKKIEKIVEGERLCFESSPVRITSFVTNPPFGWVEKTVFDNLYDGWRYTEKGFNVDFIKNIGSELNIAVEAVAYPTDEKMIEAFYEGGVDIIAGAYYDPKMKLAGHGYVVPALIQNVITVVFMKGKEKEVKKFEDLIGMKGIVREDEGFYPYVRLMLPKEMEVETAHDSRSAFTKLILGEVDYILTSPYSAEAEARRFKLNTDISMVPVPLLGQELFLLVSGRVRCPHLVYEIALRLREKRKDMNAMKRELINYIDTWGQRFKNDPGLIDQLKKEGALPEKPQDSEDSPKVEVEQPKDDKLSDLMDVK